MNPKDSKNSSSTISFVKIISVLLFFLLSVTLFITEKWLFHTWDALTIDEILYHLTTSIEGTNPEMIWNYILNYGIWIFAVFFLAVFIVLMMTKKQCTYLRHTLKSIFVVSILMLGFIFYDAENKLHFVSYIQNSFSTDGTDYIKERYADPKDIELSFPENKRNLIFIFAESMETTFADHNSGGAFNTNLIPDLTNLALEGECFNGNTGKINGSISVPGTTWTIGALFGQSSGLPLKLPISGNKMEDQSSFFPDISTLGDLLHNQDYIQFFLLGSDVRFGGRDLYYKQHGDFTINDYNWAIDSGKIPSDYYKFWGFEDQKLFQYAKEQLFEMKQSDKPFHLSILTVDTHFPDGYLCELCPDTFANDQYANVYRCANNQIKDFIDWCKQQDFYENTTIIISGDHPTMDDNFCDNVDKNYIRKNYFTIINGAQEYSSDKERLYSSLDIMPTTLAAIGVDIPGGYLGLGANLYNTETKTLLESEGINEVKSGLDRKSDFLNSMSDISITKEVLKNTYEQTYVKFSKTDTGNIIFEIRHIDDHLQSDSIDKIVLRGIRTDPNTKETLTFEYEMDIITYERDPNKFDAVYISDFTYNEDEFPWYSGSAYIWIDRFKNYKISDIKL